MAAAEFRSSHAHRRTSEIVAYFMQGLSARSKILLCYDDAANLNAIVRKLPTAVKADLICPTRQREWPADVAVPATKEKLES